MYEIFLSWTKAGNLCLQQRKQSLAVEGYVELLVYMLLLNLKTCEMIFLLLSC